LRSSVSCDRSSVGLPGRARLGYNRYAVDAFDVHAVDYLVKPVRPERLTGAIERVKLRQLGSGDGVSRRLGRSGSAGKPALARIVSTRRGVIRLFDASEITRFWSCDKYTLFVAEGEEHMTDESLTDLEARLSGHGFLRIHRAELVRVDAVRALRMQDGNYEVELSDAQLAKVSRRSVCAVKLSLGLS
jgi:DNA-binding LytR/AlgR family response regulator